MSTEQLSARQSRRDRVELGEFVPIVVSEELRSRVGRTVAILEMIDGVLEMHDNLSEITTVEDLAEVIKAEPTPTEEAVSVDLVLSEINYLPLDKIPTAGNSWDDDMYGQNKPDDRAYVHPHMKEMDGAIGSSGWHRVA